ncbi:MAG: DUF4386 domain-containing protein [Anaerolineae bacterium]|nr:DUF4386 domain-containing protein [Anaerolineae bacterium]
MNTPKLTARIAGILYFVVFVAAMFGPIYVQSTLVMPDDATATAAAIGASPSLFRAGIGSYFVILLSEIPLTILLYVLMRPVNKTLSLIAAAFRIAMTIIHGMNLLNQLAALTLLSGADYLAIFEPNQLRALMLFFLNAHELGWSIGMVFLAPHVVLLGYLVYQSGYMPRILGVLLVLAGVSYLIDGVALLLVPGYTVTPVVLAIFITVAELVFPLWLLIKGVNVKAGPRVALIPA